MRHQMIVFLQHAYQPESHAGLGYLFCYLLAQSHDPCVPTQENDPLPLLPDHSQREDPDLQQSLSRDASFLLPQFDELNPTFSSIESKGK